MHDGRWNIFETMGYFCFFFAPVWQFSRLRPVRNIESEKNRGIKCAVVT